MSETPQDTDNPLQGYFDWQVNTLMLAYDLAEPIAGQDEQTHQRRRADVEDEVRRLSLSVVPEVYRNDASLEWPPDVMMDITRVTLLRAAQVAGLVGLADPG
ncbi:MAG: hypothetical protein AAF328_04325 [Planctomycetota bacterium]